MSNPSMEVMRRSVEGHLTEIERMMEFDRGYQAGKQAMDAERHKAVRELRYIRDCFKGDPTYNSLNIAEAIGTKLDVGDKLHESICDRLIYLLGGASNNGCMGDEDDGALGCCHGRDAGSVHDHKNAVPTADVAPVTTGGYRGVMIHLDEQTKLDVERMKAIFELRKFEPMTGGKPTEEASKLIRCITGKSDSHVACGNDLEETRDRLIHLLGGDQPSGIDVLRESCKNGDNCKSGHSRTCPESGDEVSESAPSMSITDELREFKGHINAGLTPEMVLAMRAEINCIADRIDAQFDRICHQQEAVLQSTIEDNVDYDDLYAAAASFAGCDECGKYKQHMYQEFEKRIAVEQERDELQAKLDEIAGVLDA